MLPPRGRAPPHRIRTQFFPAGAAVEGVLGDQFGEASAATPTEGWARATLVWTSPLFIYPPETAQRD